MKRNNFVIAFITIIILILVFFTFYNGFNGKTNEANMKLKSSAFANGGEIPSKYTCDGENINPPLEISGVPKNAVSLILIVDDPDAIKPAGKVWDHWIVWNIAPDVKNIDEDSIPENAIQGLTSSNKNVYGGPCPPDGQHRYFFKLYALDTFLDIPDSSTKKEVLDFINIHILEEAELIGVYERQ